MSRRRGGRLPSPRARRAVWTATRPDHGVDRVVDAIIAAVRRGGDAALRDLTRRFDRARRRSIEVGPEERRAGESRVDRDARAALRFAARRIAGFARLQKRSLRSFRVRRDGVALAQRLIPVDTIGVYAPGGRHPLCSTVLMGAIPARVAGCRRVVLCTPPRRDGTIAPEILAAARLAGVDRVFAVGGAQAIAAMAIGTRSVPRVDLIVGPGNRYVAAAKARLAAEVGIDFVAGPTELLVIADRGADPERVASDLLGQAEHDPEARLWLVTLGRGVAGAVTAALRRRVAGLPPDNRRTAAAALTRLRVARCGTRRAAAAIANRVAPEHLAVQTRAPRRFLSFLNNHGSLFLGSGSAVAFGDYVSGPNHVLPTAGASRHTGGLSVLRFLKVTTVQEITASGARRLAPAAGRLAGLEGMAAHRASLILRGGRHRRSADAVLFDFDGVLVNTETHHWLAFRRVVSRLGIDLTRREYDRRYLAFDDTRALAAMLADAGRVPGRDGAPLDSLVRAKRAVFRRLAGGAPPLEPGAARLVRSLARRAPLAVVSGAAGAEVRGALRRAGIASLFRSVVTAEDVRRSKPDPEGYLLALRRLGVTDARTCLALEDSPGGIRAARAAGLPVIGVATTYPARALRGAGAFLVVRRVGHLTRALLETLP